MAIQRAKADLQTLQMPDICKNLSIKPLNRLYQPHTTGFEGVQLMKNVGTKRTGLACPPFKLNLLTPGQTQSAVQSPLVGAKIPLDINVP